MARELLRSFGKLGVSGPSTEIFGGRGRCSAEAVSVYAEVYHRMGNLPVDR